MRLPLLLVLFVSLALPGAALAQEKANIVGVSNDLFTPADLTIKVNETVIWRWTEPGFHSVTSISGPKSFNLEAADRPAGSDFAQNFPTAGTVKYVCTIHAGMEGSIKVVDPSAPVNTAPKLTSVSTKPSKLCTGKSRRGCKKPGSTVSYTLSEKATIKVTVAKRSSRSKIVKTYSIKGKSGKHTFKLGTGGLKEAKYVMKLVATDAAGLKSKSKSVNFEINNP